MIQTHCMWTSSPLIGTSGPQMRTSSPHKKTHAGKGCLYKTMFKLDRIYPYIKKKQNAKKKHCQQISRTNPTKIRGFKAALKF